MEINLVQYERNHEYVEKVVAELERVLYEDEEDFIEYNNTMGNCGVDKTEFKPSSLTFEQIKWLIEEVVRQDFLRGIRPTITIRSNCDEKEMSK